MTDKAVIVGKKTRPWENKSLVSKQHTDNAEANKRALAAMDDCQRETGWTAEQVRAWHQAQRQRVLERLREAQQ